MSFNFVPLFLEPLLRSRLLSAIHFHLSVYLCFQLHDALLNPRNISANQRAEPVDLFTCSSWFALKIPDIYLENAEAMLSIIDILTQLYATIYELFQGLVGPPDSLAERLAE